MSNRAAGREKHGKILYPIPNANSSSLKLLGGNRTQGKGFVMRGFLFQSSKARREILRGAVIVIVLFLPTFLPDLALWVLLGGGAWILAPWLLGLIYAFVLVLFGAADE